MTSASFRAQAFLQVSSEDMAGLQPGLERYGGVKPSLEGEFARAGPSAAPPFIEHLL